MPTTSRNEIDEKRKEKDKPVMRAKHDGLAFSPPWLSPSSPRPAEIRRNLRLCLHRRVSMASSICFLHQATILPEPPGHEIPQTGSMPVSPPPTGAAAQGVRAAPSHQRSTCLLSIAGTHRAKRNGTEREEYG